MKMFGLGCSPIDLRKHAKLAKMKVQIAKPRPRRRKKNTPFYILVADPSTMHGLENIVEQAKLLIQDDYDTDDDPGAVRET